METFNDLSLSELFITMKHVNVTAIGHTVDETLLDKLADKRFHLPHEYGAGLTSFFLYLKMTSIFPMNLEIQNLLK